MLRGVGVKKGGARTGCKAVCSLLYESDPRLQEIALRTLNDICHDWWFEMCSEMEQIMGLIKSETGVSKEGREVGALLISKLYFHLASNNYDASLVFALRSPEMFLKDEYKLYVDKVMVKGLDRYKDVAVGKSVWAEREEEALLALTHKLIDKSIANSQWKETIGFAIECGDAVTLSRCIRSDTTGDLMRYAKDVLGAFPPWKGFRKPIYTALAELCREQKDWLGLIDTLSLCESVHSLAEEFHKLLGSPDPKDLLLLFQAAFDLVENATSIFVRDLIRIMGDKTTATPPGEALFAILRGTFQRQLYQHFLVKENYKIAEEFLHLIVSWRRVHLPVTQTAAMIAHAFIHLGSGNTDFIIDHLKWAQLGVRWNEFSAAASIGIIFKYNLERAMDALSSILPRAPPGQLFSPSSRTELYSFGGGLFALGLLAANQAQQPIIDYIVTKLEYKEIPLKAGACLGVGTAAMGTHRRDIFDKIISASLVWSKEHEDTGLEEEDLATLGAAGAIGAGLLMVSSGTAVHDRLLQLATEVKSDKIRRGLSLSLALLQFGLGGAAETAVKTLCSDRDAELRRAGALAEGTAFVGTGNTSAVSRLLRMAVTDVNADVRRAAGTALGLVVSNVPVEDAIGLLVPLLCGYCPHTRYGGLMALGICTAGSGNNEALKLLIPMMEDSSMFVREGAMVAAGLISIGTSDALSPAWKTLRERMTRISTSHPHTDDPLLIFGSIIGLAIGNAGGRNLGITTSAGSGRAHMETMVGLLLFTEHWNWFPLTHFLSLAFRPLSVFVLNEKLVLSAIDLRCIGPIEDSLPPPIIKEEKVAVKTDRYHAVLSFVHKPSATPPGILVPSPPPSSACPRLQTPTPVQSAESAVTQKGSGTMEVGNASRVTRVQRKRLQGFNPANAIELVKDIRCGGTILVGRATMPLPHIPLEVNYQDVTQHAPHQHGPHQHGPHQQPPHMHQKPSGPGPHGGIVAPPGFTVINIVQSPAPSNSNSNSNIGSGPNPNNPK